MAAEIRDARRQPRQARRNEGIEGHEHGGTGISTILVDAPPGGGPSLHRHDYDEIDIHLNPRYVTEWPA